MELTKKEQTAKVLDMYENCLELVTINTDINEILQYIDDCKKSLTDPLLIHQLILFRHTMEEYLQD